MHQPIYLEFALKIIIGVYIVLIIKFIYDLIKNFKN